MPHTMERDGRGIDATTSVYRRTDHTGSGVVLFYATADAQTPLLDKIDVTTKLSLLVHAKGNGAARSVSIKEYAHPDAEGVEIANGTAADGAMTEIHGGITRGYCVEVTMDGDGEVVVVLKS